eukprot:SAG22_NODE_2554_length_2452_cov_1.600510_1_plen_260_part_00
MEHDAQLDCVAVGGGTIAAGSVAGRLQVWLWSAKVGWSAKAEYDDKTAGGGQEIRAVAVSADGLRVLAGGDDGIARVWPLEKPTLGRQGQLPMPWELAGHDDWIYSVALSSDSTTAATGSGDGTMRLWRLPALNTQAGCFGCGVSPDGAAAISGSLEVRRWDVSRAAAQSKAATTSGSHTGPVVAVAVCGDGKTALSIGKDGLLKAWGLAGKTAGKLLETKNCFRGRCVRFRALCVRACVQPPGHAHCHRRSAAAEMPV